MPDVLRLYSGDDDTTGLDLSTYVDVAEGGINPGDEATRSPVMSQGSLGYGEQVVHVQVKARPFTVALLLNADSVDAVGALQQRIETYLASARAAIEWRRQGAAASTWFRIRYGRVLGDARYDHKRESQTRHAKRVLALIVEPFGTGSRLRYITGVGTAPVMHPPTGAGWASAQSFAAGVAVGIAPSNPAMGQLPSIGGDSPVRWRIAVGGTAASPGGDGGVATGFFPGRVVCGISATAYSVGGLNAATSQPTTARIRHNAGTLMGPTAYLADPWSPGGGYALQFTGTRLGSGAQIDLAQALVNGAWAPTAPPPGLYRLFAAIRSRQHTTAGSSVPARAQVQSDGIRGPVATLALRSPSQYAWYDMGDVVDLDDISINFGFPTGFTGIASPMFNLAGFAAIPKHTRYWEIDNQAGVGANRLLGVAADADDGLTPAGVVNDFALPNLHRIDGLFQRSAIRGDLPITAPIPSGGTSAWHVAALAFRDSQTIGAFATQSHHPEERVIVAVAAWDRYTFAK